MEEEYLRIRVYDEIPSAEEFVSQIEPKNVPAAFIGCVKNWKALSEWNPSHGGLDYMRLGGCSRAQIERRVGSSTVEAMVSKSAPVFYGDIRSHERVSLSFSVFVDHCMELLQNREADGDACPEQENHELAVSDGGKENFPSDEYASHQIYLAQVPMMNMEKEDRVQLGNLKDDIQTPAFLGTKALVSVNLWMNSANTRSSTHYDPHHNLLCVVSGCKTVVLWPPSATPFLYPMPLYGEASNHSAVSLEKPDLSIHPRAEHSMEHSWKVILHAGDALFIPEGWYHQVDSDCLTIAVNFWWQSNMMCDMLEHMDSYYLRRILKRLTDKEMDRMLSKTSVGSKVVTNSIGHASNGIADLGDQRSDQNHGSSSSGGDMPKQKLMLHELEPVALQSLHELVSLVHDHISNQTQLADSASTSNSIAGEKDKSKKIAKADLSTLEDDPVANILWTLQPRALRSVFLAMAYNFPRTLEALILHLLSPIGAEVLTRKFDEMDQLIAAEDRNEFYRIIYDAFDDQFAAMDVLLNGKERFALQAFKNVLDRYLAINIDGQKQ